MNKEFVSCANAACKNAFLSITLETARAMIEFRSIKDSSAKFVFNFDQCGRENSYTYSDILELMDPDSLPKLLPNEFRWVFVLAELPTGAAMKEKCFLGERILVKDFQLDCMAWQGRIANISKFAPWLIANCAVGGTVSNGFFVCDYYIDDLDQRREIVVENVPQGSDVIGLFIAPKDEFKLQAANLFCGNPSCGYIFQMTYKAFRNMMGGVEAEQEAIEADAYITLTCPICKISRIINEDSFSDLFKM